MSQPANELKPTDSADSTNSNTPFKQSSNNKSYNTNMESDNNNNNNDKEYIHAPSQSLHEPNNATMIINESDLQNIKLELEEDDEQQPITPKDKEAIPDQSPAINNLQTNEDNHLSNNGHRNSHHHEYSHSLSGRSHGAESVGSITRQTDYTDKPKSPQANPLDTTKLRHHGDDVEIGHLSDDENSPVITPYGAHHESRMPRYVCMYIYPCTQSLKPLFDIVLIHSISYNNVDKELAALRRASRRKWWSPTRLCDWCMHKLFFGKVMVMILTWTTVVDYGKDLYVAYHLGLTEKWPEFAVTLCILFLSLRLMLYLRAIDDSGVSFWKLLIFYLPGSVYADFQIDRMSDIGVCVFWEIAILFGTPFVPFFLIYLAIRKSVSLFSCLNQCLCKNKGGTSPRNSFENPYLLSYAVVEALFETLPQLCLQTYLYFVHAHDKEPEIEIQVFIIAWIVSILVLIKIPIVVWYNWRIVYKLSFKRRHAGEIMSIKYHPIQDLIATGSWDHTVLINSIIDGSSSKHSSNRRRGGRSKSKRRKKKSSHTENMDDNPEIKAKRVLDHHYNINCIAWMPKFMNSIHDPNTDIIAVAGQGIELFNWRMGKSIGQFPKNRDRDALRRKKRHRTKEVKEVCFSPDAKRLIWCQGKNVLVWDLAEKKELLKIKCIQGNRLGDVMSIDISPNGKYIACGLYQHQIKVYNSYNKDLIRVLEGHTDAVMCVRFDRQGKYIISGGADGKVRVFDLRYGEQIKKFDGHKSDVMCISIDYTNRYIASAGRDRTLLITYLDDEDLTTTDADKERSRKSTTRKKSHSAQQPLKQLRQLKDWIPYRAERDIRCCDFSPYGDTIACASEDHQVHIISLPQECHIRQHRFSTDIGNILHRVHTPQKDIPIIDHNTRNNNGGLQEIHSNDEALPEPEVDDEGSQNNDTTLNVGVVQRQFSNIDAITTNDYNKFDPKEHKLW